MIDTVKLFGFDFVSAPDYGPIFDYLDNRKSDGDKLPLIITPNVDQLVKYHRKENAELLSTLQNAELVLPDGQPIVWTSKLKRNSAPLASRLTGSDLFPQLWEYLKEKNKRVFFILPNARLGDQLKAEYSEAQYYAPPYFSLESEEEYSTVLEHCLEQIRFFKPDHVSIGLGFPKQEQLALDIHRHTPEQDIMFSLLGASFEFYLGEKSRAPKWMQNLGLEFLHRLLSEPGRMAKRYLIDDMAFIPLLIRELRRP